MSMPFGMLWELRRHMPTNTAAQFQHPGLVHWPCAVDVKCRNTRGSALTVPVTGGYSAVILDLADIAQGRLPPVTIPTASVELPILGVIVDGQGDIADGDTCWVRVFGQHDDAQVDGTTDVAVGDFLTPHGTTGGALTKYANGKQWAAQALAARTDNSIAGLSIFLWNPLRLPIG